MLSNPKIHVDVGFVQGGVSKGMNLERLVSLGSVFHEPLALFCRTDGPVEMLSALTGKKGWPSARKGAARGSWP
jgi:hypothetical protein